jgi:BirA family biotin operon repressor/biotin-[acetyl-CoA-carboxylase] ligase
MSFDQERLMAAYGVVRQCGEEQGHRGAFDLSEDRLHVFETLESTNQVAWELMQAGIMGGIAGEGMVVIGLTQTAGRGQRGRQWRSPQGGLYFSVGLQPEVSADRATQLTLCTAWGLATALREIPSRLSGVANFIPVQLKWLNDLVLLGYKLGGILTETRVRGQQVTKAVVGVGINWTNPTPETGINLQSFLETQPVPLIESLEMLAAIALYGLSKGYHSWQQAGIEPILPWYLELLAHRDRPIPFQGQMGKIVGITSTGELRIQLELPENVAGKGFQDLSRPEVIVQPGTIRLGYPV